MESDEEPGGPSQSPEAVDWWIQHLGLTWEDKNILLNEGKWLNDKHIEAAMEILKTQFPHLKGLNPPHKCQPQKNQQGKWHYLHRLPQAISDAVQIHHTGESHWVTSFQTKGRVFLLDSARIRGNKKYNAPESLQIQLSSMYATKGRNLEICIPDIMRQSLGNCGVHAIANAVYLCIYGQAPTNITFRMGMRQHLVTCLENGMFTEFKFSRNSEKLSSSECAFLTIEINCPCRLPNFFDDMIQCDNCKLWFHYKCQNIPDIQQIEERAKFFCSSCKTETPNLPIPRLLTR